MYKTQWYWPILKTQIKPTLKGKWFPSKQISPLQVGQWPREKNNDSYNYQNTPLRKDSGRVYYCLHHGFEF